MLASLLSVASSVCFFFFFFKSRLPAWGGTTHSGLDPLLFSIKKKKRRVSQAGQRWVGGWVGETRWVGDHVGHG